MQNRIYPTLFFFLLTTFYLKAQVTVVSKVNSIEKANTGLDERSVVISSPLGAFFFTRAKKPVYKISTRDLSDIWSYEPTNKVANKINFVGYDASEDELVLDSWNNGKSILLGKNGKLFSTQVINDSTWQKAIPLSIKFFKNNAEHISASISRDQKLLVVALESYNSYGVEDIYIARKLGDGNWSQLKNLGSTINTTAQETYPFLSADNKTLYFASNGFKGSKGSFDIYYAKRIGPGTTDWSQPKALLGVNTSGSDYGFNYVYGDSLAYLISTSNSDGYGDVKYVSITPDIPANEVDSIKSPVASDSIKTIEIAKLDSASSSDSLDLPVTKIDSIRFKGFILSAKDNKPVISEIILKDSIKSYKTETFQNGEFNFKLTIDQLFPITINADGFLSKDTVISSSSKNIAFFTVKLSPIVEGKKITLDHVLFERGKSTMLHGSEAQLDLIVSMLKKNQKFGIFLEGHTDNNGDARLNLKLSQDRVKVVERYLIARGIDKSRVKGQGYGGKRPIASNSNEISRQKNRRVEFFIRSL